MGSLFQIAMFASQLACPTTKKGRVVRSSAKKHHRVDIFAIGDENRSRISMMLEWALGDLLR